MPIEDKKLAKPSVGKSSPSATGADPVVVSLKVTLRGSKPPIWRRLLVPGNMNLGALHVALQSAMDWRDHHLHVFDIDGRQYGNPKMVDDVDNEARLTLDRIMKTGVTRFTYTYDFGDDWEHVVAIEKTQAAVAGEAYPVCTAGKRAAPPEDCGGPWGYQELLEVMADPTHPDYAERAEWLDDEFAPEHFDLETVNTLLRSRFGRVKAGGR